MKRKQNCYIVINDLKVNLSNIRDQEINPQDKEIFLLGIILPVINIKNQ